MKSMLGIFSGTAKRANPIYLWQTRAIFVQQYQCLINPYVMCGIYIMTFQWLTYAPNLRTCEIGKTHIETVMTPSLRSRKPWWQLCQPFSMA